MEDRSKRTETVRPQSNERFEKRQGCDSVLSATKGENGVELNGETADEDMEDGEVGFDDGSAQVRKHPRPRPTDRQRAPSGHDHTSTAQIMAQVLCAMGRGVNAPQRRSDTQEDLEGVPRVSVDYGFLGERESEEQVSPVLVIRERRHKMTWAMLVPREGTEFSLDRKESSEGSFINSGTTQSRFDVTTSQRLRH